jgi:hypothetical protein
MLRLGRSVASNSTLCSTSHRNNSTERVGRFNNTLCVSTRSSLKTCFSNARKVMADLTGSLTCHCRNILRGRLLPSDHTTDRYLPCCCIDSHLSVWSIKIVASKVVPCRIHYNPSYMTPSDQSSWQHSAAAARTLSITATSKRWSSKSPCNASLRPRGVGVACRSRGRFPKGLENLQYGCFLTKK